MSGKCITLVRQQTRDPSYGITIFGSGKCPSR